MILLLLFRIGIGYFRLMICVGGVLFGSSFYGMVWVVLV